MVQDMGRLQEIYLLFFEWKIKKRINSKIYVLIFIFSGTMVHDMGRLRESYLFIILYFFEKNKFQNLFIVFSFVFIF